MTTWKDKLSPEALERKRERDRQRYKGVNANQNQVTVFVKEEKYLTLWKTIPNKAEWLGEQIKKYAEEHKNDNMER